MDSESSDTYSKTRLNADLNVIGGEAFNGFIYRVMKADFEVLENVSAYEMTTGRKFDLG